MTAAPAHAVSRPVSAPAPPALAVRRLSLSDFRSYGAASLEVEATPVVLTGPNGAGKTNLLEALSFLAPGRGLRRARLADVQRRANGEPQGRPWAVAARVATPDGEVGLGTGPDPEVGLDAGGVAGRRVVRIDGAPAKSQGALAERLTITWLTPQMDRLFMDGPGARRRFLDRLVYGFDAAHAGRVAAFEQAMRERLRLLGGASDPAWLDALEAQMAERGVAIAAARRELAARLDAACADGVGPFPRARLAAAGTLEGWLDGRPAVEAEDRYAAALRAARDADGRAGGCALGPHRSDLAVHWRDRDLPAAVGSTGEQKALLVSIVLAHARLLTVERGAPPLLLLDEVAAHLDAARRAALFDEIVALQAQSWLTGTDRVLFDAFADRAQRLRIEDSRPVPDGA